MEVFTTADQEAQWPSVANNKAARQNLDLHIYKLDSIQRFETQLSNNLPTDPNQSKQIALQRIQQLDKQATLAIQSAAISLAKAMQYGIDRYPSIVFDGVVVVYGLTDLSTALDHYQTWQTENRP
ncbi:MAG: TIGR03757 family integrating conjugative element protein [Gammaproteobacteria bacterium]|nr:TIGR03757 family integrating conjugative element protein [Gammaproteobacteria bacterium]